MKISPVAIIPAIALTPERLTFNKLIDGAHKVTVTASEVRNLNNTVNEFAFDTYVGILTAQESLVETDKTKHPHTADALIQTVKDVSAAYAAAAYAATQKLVIV